MVFDEDTTACAALLERADPVRFRAAMAAPVEARKILFPLYAMNVEVARAPWVTAEGMIAEMRLQWWRDALEEIALGKTPRRHEVVTPLSQVLDAQGAAALDALVAARRWDIYKDAFEDAAHFAAYLSDTAGELMWQAARALGAPETAAHDVRRFGAATGLVRFLQAVPELESHKRIPLVDGREAAIAELATQAQSEIVGQWALQHAVGQAAKPALIEGFMTQALLAQVANAPGRVAAGAVELNPLRQSFLLWRWS